MGRPARSTNGSKPGRRPVVPSAKPPTKLSAEEAASGPPSFFPAPRTLVSRYDARNLDLVMEELGLNVPQVFWLVRFNTADENLTALTKHYLSLSAHEQDRITLSDLCLQFNYSPAKLFGAIAEEMFARGVEEARQIVAINYPQLTKGNIEMALAGNTDISEEWMKLGGFRVVNKGAVLPENLTVNVNAQATAVAASGNLGTFEQRIARYEQQTRQLAPASAAVTVDAEIAEPAYVEPDNDED